LRIIPVSEENQDSEKKISRDEHLWSVLRFTIMLWCCFAVLAKLIIIMNLRNAQVPVAVAILLFPGAFFIAGMFFGIIFGVPLHRWMVVKYSQPNDESIRITWPAKLGRSIGSGPFFFLMIVLLVVSFFSGALQ